MADFHRHVSVAVKTVSVPAVAAGACARQAQEEGRPVSRARVGGAPGAYEWQVRTNRTRSYTATANLETEIVIFYVSYRVFTDERNSLLRKRLRQRIM